MMPRRPAAIGTWVLLAYATGIAALIGLPAIATWRAGLDDVLLMTIPMVAWIVAPAALAAVLAAGAKSKGEAWLLLGAEVAAVASTGWLCAYLFSLEGHENAQAGVALLMLPVAQWAVVISFASAVIGTAMILRARSAAA